MSKGRVRINGKEFGMLEEGFVIPDFEDCRKDMIVLWRQSFGSEIPTDGDSKIGQIIHLTSQRYHQMWILARSLSIANDPSSAEGKFLDQLCRLINVHRKEAKRTRVTGKLIGQNGTRIPSGSRVLTRSKDRFFTRNDVTIEQGFGIAEFESSEFGKIPVYADNGTDSNSLHAIETPVFGWEGVTNERDGVLGSFRETDAELRQRRDQVLNSVGDGRIESITEKLRSLRGVSIVICYENDTKRTDENLQPANTLQFFVAGGDGREIAEVLWRYRPGAIRYFGDTSFVVQDSRGVDRTIFFTRPAEILIYIKVTVTRKNPDFPENGAALIQRSIIERAGGLSMGEDVIVEYLKGAYSNTKGLIRSDFLIGTSENPVSSDDIQISETQYASFDTSRIRVIIN